MFLIAHCKTGLIRHTYRRVVVLIGYYRMLQMHQNAPHEYKFKVKNNLTEGTAQRGPLYASDTD